MSKRQRDDANEPNGNFADNYDFEMQITNQIVVETEPITRLQNSILHISKPLLTIAESFKDSPECKKYPYCVLILDSEGISSAVWNLLSCLCDDMTLATIEIDTNALDDLLYVLHKYDIQLSGNRYDQLSSFMHKSLLIGNTVFKRMTCYESNQLYFPMVMKHVHFICGDDVGISINLKINIIKNLAPQMWLNLLIKNIK